MPPSQSSVRKRDLTKKAPYECSIFNQFKKTRNINVCRMSSDGFRDKNKIIILDTKYNYCENPSKSLNVKFIYFRLNELNQASYNNVHLKINCFNTSTT